MIRHACRNLCSVLKPPYQIANVELELSQLELGTPWKLPSDIVNTIFGLLSDLDRACFALSCKRLHGFYVSYNKKYRISVMATLPRQDFLRRLQNDRWIYCAICQRLHQPSRWKALMFGKKCSPRPSPESIIDCMDPNHIQHLGLVDLCPCSSITYHQKHHTNEYFRQKAKASSSNSKYTSCSKGYGAFYHFCLFEHPQALARVFIKTTVQYNAYTKTFWVENQFTFRVPKKRAEVDFRMISSQISRHDTEFWIKDFFRGAQSSFFIGNDSSNWYQCHGWDYSKTEPGTFMILLNRNLGGTKGLDRVWEHNCHF